MSRRANRRGIWAVALAAVMTVTGMFSTNAGAQEERPLEGARVLVTNDDSMQNSRPNGSDGEGLYEVRRSLCQAGADVVVVAPWGYQSGAGTAVTNSGVMRMEQRTELQTRYAADCAEAPSAGAVFGVCRSDVACTAESLSGTPTDTVRLAVRGGLEHAVGWTDGPDLVVSGINSGPNTGSSVNDSGTAGAALAALSVATPGVAFSAWPDDENHLETYRRTAEFAARFVAELVAQDALTRSYALNVNYPALEDLDDDGEPGGPVIAPVGTGTTARHTYTATDDLTFALSITSCEVGDPSCVPETREDADHLVNRAGSITVTPLTPDRTYQDDVTELQAVVDALAEQPPTVAPSLSLSVTEVRAGESFEATGEGLAGGTTYAVRLASDDASVPLGEVTTANEGTFVAALTVPRDTDPGRYEVRLFLVGEDVGITAELTVLAAAEDPSPTPGGPVTEPDEPADPARGPVDAGRGDLPAAGADVAPLGLLAGLVMIAGAGVLWAAKRRAAA